MSSHWLMTSHGLTSVVVPYSLCQLLQLDAHKQRDGNLGWKVMSGRLAAYKKTCVYTLQAPLPCGSGSQYAVQQVAQVQAFEACKDCSVIM